jgi:hypothetical protein
MARTVAKRDRDPIYRAERSAHALLFFFRPTQWAERLVVMTPEAIDGIATHDRVDISYPTNTPPMNEGSFFRDKAAYDRYFDPHRPEGRIYTDLPIAHHVVTSTEGEALYLADELKKRGYFGHFMMEPL